MVKLHFISAIELSPYDYAEEDYPVPNNSVRDQPSEWNKFWKRCLSDKNLDALDAVREGGYFVEINQLGLKELKTIIQLELESIELSDFEEQAVPLYGGIIVKRDNEVILEPQCCGDLRNLSDWKAILTEMTDKWQMLWIGHPWIFYRLQGEMIEFSNLYEKNAEEIEEFETTFCVTISELTKQLALMEDNQIDLYKRIRTILQELKIENGNEIALILSGIGLG